MNNEEKKKNNRTIIICIAFVLFGVSLMFLIDYFKKKELLKNGIHANATVSARYYEVSDKGDTSSYSMRLRVVQDNNLGDVLNAYVKKKSFDKYEEGAVVKVVYKKDDADHAKLVEDIE